MGLRAIAVISVIIYHLNENWLSGGFLWGGYFLCYFWFSDYGYYIAEIQQNSFFSFKQFYTRRIKRIYPAFYYSDGISVFHCVRYFYL